MKVLISGGSGFIGRQLTRALLDKGYRVVIVDRHAPKEKVDFVQMELGSGPPESKLFAEVEAVIQLAGKNLFLKWNPGVKKAIYDSRIKSTQALVSAIGNAKEKPQVFISASAVGYYGDRGEAELYETSNPGTDFLAEVCRDWEKEARKVEELGLRCVQVRTAPVLGEGGLLKALLPFYKTGLGGPLGDGSQWNPWIHIRDIVGAYLFALENKTLSGPVNACAPQPIRNRDFCAALARTLHKPAFLRMPRFALKIIFGELAEAILAGQKVYPKKLLEAGFRFAFPRIKEALADVLLLVNKERDGFGKGESS